MNDQPCTHDLLTAVCLRPECNPAPAPRRRKLRLGRRRTA